MDAFKDAEILVVDDELSMRQMLRAQFEEAGYKVREAQDGEEGLSLCRERSPDLILLDVMMPRMDGISMCKKLREDDLVTPVLFYTAMPHEVTLVVGLGCGGDDYISKTCSEAELLARVAAAIRRTRALAACVRPPAPEENSFRIGPLLIDLDDSTVYTEEGVFGLSRSEARVMALLSQHRGRLVSYDMFLSALGGNGYSGTDESVRKIMQRLKAKLGAPADQIVGVAGQGYRLLQA